MNEYVFDEITIGMKESFTKEITLEMENAFRQLSGDNNPLHRDDEYAREIGDGKFPSHVSFGMLTASLYSTMAGMYMPGKYSLIHSLDGLSFYKPVFAGDTLTVTGEVMDKDENLNLIQLKVDIRNQNNEKISKTKMKILVLK